MTAREDTKDYRDFLGLDEDQMDVLVTEARAWLLDVFGDYRDQDYGTRQVLRFIDLNYVGAVRQFADDIAPLLERT